MLGLSSLREWMNDGQVHPEPEAQGPAPFPDGQIHARGPFALSRHPLNFAPLTILWLWPRMTTSLLAFNVTATIYLVIGSVHEEARLRDAYGDEYEAYLKSGVRFYLPDLERSTTNLIQSLPNSESASSGVKTFPEAKKSSAKIYKMFLDYLRVKDFPGADMARKFLQMGWTRARRYANRKNGRKYEAKTHNLLPLNHDEGKAKAAAVFYERYVAARNHSSYLRQKEIHSSSDRSQ